MKNKKLEVKKIKRQKQIKNRRLVKDRKSTLKQSENSKRTVNLQKYQEKKSYIKYVKVIRTGITEFQKFMHDFKESPKLSQFIRAMSCMQILFMCLNPPLYEVHLFKLSTTINSVFQYISIISLGAFEIQSIMPFNIYPVIILTLMFFSYNLSLILVIRSLGYKSRVNERVLNLLRFLTHHYSDLLLLPSNYFCLFLFSCEQFFSDEICVDRAISTEGSRIRLFLEYFAMTVYLLGILVALITTLISFDPLPKIKWWSSKKHFYLELLDIFQKSLLPLLQALFPAKKIYIVLLGLCIGTNLIKLLLVLLTLPYYAIPGNSFSGKISSTIVFIQSMILLSYLDLISIYKLEFFLIIGIPLIFHSSGKVLLIFQRIGGCENNSKQAFLAEHFLIHITSLLTHLKKFNKGHFKFQNYKNDALIGMGVLANHIENCLDPGCPCKKRSTFSVQAQIPSEEHFLVLGLLNRTYVSAMQRIPKSIYLNLIYAHFCIIHRENLHVSYAQMTSVRKKITGISNRVFLYKLLKMIGDRLAKLYLKKAEVSSMKTNSFNYHETDVCRIMLYENCLNDLTSVIKIHIQSRFSLFSEAENSKISLFKISKIAKGIKRLEQQMNLIWKKLMNICNANSYSPFILYGIFCIYGRNRPFQGGKLLKEFYKKFSTILKTEQLQSKGTLEMTMFEGKVGSLQISGEKKKSGEILYASNNSFLLFNREKTDMIGCNINTLMPGYIANFHDVFLQEFAKTNQSSLFNQLRALVATDGEGSLFRFKILIKFFPDLSSGISYISMIHRPSKYENERFLVTEPGGKIIGLSKSASNDFNVNPNLLIASKIGLGEICSDLNPILLTLNIELANAISKSVDWDYIKNAPAIHGSYFNKITNFVQRFQHCPAAQTTLPIEKVRKLLATNQFTLKIPRLKEESFKKDEEASHMSSFLSLFEAEELGKIRDHFEPRKSKRKGAHILESPQAVCVYKMRIKQKIHKRCLAYRIFFLEHGQNVTHLEECERFIRQAVLSYGELRKIYSNSHSVALALGINENSKPGENAGSMLSLDFSSKESDINLSSVSPKKHLKEIEENQIQEENEESIQPQIASGYFPEANISEIEKVSETFMDVTSEKKFPIFQDFEGPKIHSVHPEYFQSKKLKQRPEVFVFENYSLKPEGIKKGPEGNWDKEDFKKKNGIIKLQQEKRSDLWREDQKRMHDEDQKINDLEHSFYFEGDSGIEAESCSFSQYEKGKAVSFTQADPPLPILGSRKKAVSFGAKSASNEDQEIVLNYHNSAEEMDNRKQREKIKENLDKIRQLFLFIGDKSISKHNIKVMIKKALALSKLPSYYASELLVIFKNFRQPSFEEFPLSVKFGDNFSGKSENPQRDLYQSEQSSINTSGQQHKLSQLENALDEDYKSQNLRIMAYSFNFLWLISFFLAVSNYLLRASFISNIYSSLNLLEYSKERVSSLVSTIQLCELLYAHSLGYYSLEGELDNINYYNSTEEFLRLNLKENIDNLVSTNFNFSLSLSFLGEELTRYILSRNSSVQTDTEGIDERVKRFVVYSYSILTSSLAEIASDPSDLKVVESGINDLFINIVSDESVISTNLESVRESNIEIYTATLIIATIYTFCIILAFPPLYLLIKREEIQVLQLFEFLPNKEIENQKATLEFLMRQVEELQHSYRKPLDFYIEIAKSFEYYKANFQTTTKTTFKPSFKNNLKTSSTKGMFGWFWMKFLGVFTVAMISILQNSLNYYYLHNCIFQNTIFLSQLNEIYYLEGYENVASVGLSILVMHNGTSDVLSNDAAIIVDSIYEGLSERINSWTNSFMDNSELATFEIFERIAESDLCEIRFTDPPENYPCNNWMDFSAKKGILALLGSARSTGTSFYKAFLQSNRTTEDIKALFSSQEFTEYSFVQHKLIQKVLSEQYSEVKDSFEQELVSEKSVFLSICLVYFGVFGFALLTIWLKVFIEMKKGISQLKNIIGLIPLDTIFSNKFIQNRLKKISKVFVSAKL